MNKINDRWSALSMKDRADLIKLYTDNGITDIKVMRKDYNGIPYRDFNTSEYDYFNAHPSNAPTKEGEHWTSRNHKTGQLLKREDHPTFDLMIEGEKQAGYKVIRGYNGKLYSIPNEPNNYVEDYNSFATGGSTTWEKVDEVVDTAEPWVSGASLALLGATAVQPELGVVTIPAMAVANGAGVLFDGYQAVRDFQNGNYRSGAWNSIEAITGAFGAKAASKLARTAGGRAIGKFKEQLVEDRFRASGDKIARLMRKGLTYEKAAERVLQNAVNYVDNSSKVKDVSNGIREAYNKKFDTGATVLDAVFDTTDVGEGIFSRFKDEHPIEIYKLGGKLNKFTTGGFTELNTNEPLITREEYLNRQRQNVIIQSIENSNSRIKPAVPYIGKYKDQNDWEFQINDRRQSLLNLIDEATKFNWGKEHIDTYESDLKDLEDEYNRGYKQVNVPGATCIYTATDNYGKKYRVAGNKTFRSSPEKYGFTEINLNDIKPGDIIQDFSVNGTPTHALTFIGYDEKGKAMFNYSSGDYTEKAIRKNKNYPFYSEYGDPLMLNNEDNSDLRTYAAAYRFIGTQEDNNMWNNTYNQLRKNYAQNITNELKKAPTPITGKAVQLNKSKLLTK